MKRQVILLIGDTHAPYHHKDIISFYNTVKKKYRPNDVIHMGDLLDNHAISYHESDPDLYSAGYELEESKLFIKELSNIFKNMIILSGNHDNLGKRKAKSIGLPSRYIRDLKDVFNMPKGWEFKQEHKMLMSDNRTLWLKHQFCSNPIKLAMKYNVCIAQGHYHSIGCMQWIMNKQHNVFALTVGCGIDNNSRAFEYNRLDKEPP